MPGFAPLALLVTFMLNALSVAMSVDDRQLKPVYLEARPRGNPGPAAIEEVHAATAVAAPASAPAPAAAAASPGVPLVRVSATLRRTLQSVVAVSSGCDAPGAKPEQVEWAGPHLAWRPDGRLQSAEDAHATRPHEEAEHDECDSPRDGAANDAEDAADDQ